MKLIELQNLLGKEVHKLSNKKELTSFEIERGGVDESISKRSL